MLIVAGIVNLGSGSACRGELGRIAERDNDARVPLYAGHRFPGEIISYAVWLYFRFPLSLRHIDELLGARGIDVSHKTVRQWSLKFGQAFANQIRRRLPYTGGKWHGALAIAWASLQP